VHTHTHTHSTAHTQTQVQPSSELSAALSGFGGIIITCARSAEPETTGFHRLSDQSQSIIRKFNKQIDSHNDIQCTNVVKNTVKDP
jgi:hypothetical protein